MTDIPGFDDDENSSGTDPTDDESRPSDEGGPSISTRIHDTITTLYGDGSRRPLTTRFVGFFVLSTLFYLWRPLFHVFFYNMRYSLSGLIAGSLIILLFLVLWFSPRVYEDTAFPRAKSVRAKVGVFIVAFPLIGAVYWIASTGFGIFFSIILGISLVVAGLYIILKHRGESNPGNFPGFSPRTLTVVWIVGAIFTASIFLVSMSALVQQRAMAEQAMDSAVEIDNFPSVNEDNPRIVPRAVDENKASGSVSYRKYRLGTSDVARGPNGSLMWSYPIQPDGLRNMLFENQQGVALSDMTAMSDREFNTHDNSSFVVGEGMLLHRGSKWNLRKTDYWSQYNDDSVDFVYDGDPYMAYPKTGHEWEVDLVGGVIPVPYTVPTWDGVALLDESGTVNHMDPEEAQESNVLEGQRLYPFDLTTKYTNSLGYRNGIINQFAVIGEHENEVEVADLPSGAGNSQPFMVDLAGEEFVYMVALEPYGKDTRGLDEVWIVNSRTGEYEYFGTEGDTLFGPERAMGVVRSEDTQTGWGDDFEVVEPVPTVVDGDLWWHSKVVPTDSLDVARNVFVNSDTGDAVEVYETESVVQFINGSEDVDIEVDDVGDDANGTDGDSPRGQVEESDGDVAYVVTIVAENGTVIDEVPVTENQEVEIIPGNRTNNSGD